MKHITIIEDDIGLNNGIALALKQEDITFFQLYRLGDFQPSEPTDLIILDINLPDGNGFDFLRKLRQNSDVPVIILTANDLETDEVMGLELGADDYITKPFSLMVLRARIDKVLKKINSSVNNVYTDDTYSFDFNKMEFYVDGSSVELSKTEQKLLRLLIQNKGQTLTRDLLVDRIWTDGADYVDENALSVTVGRLRKKLNAANYIQTVYGIGYAWRGRSLSIVRKGERIYV
jgi:DNA-binding response OmpR family regulator